MELNNTIAYFFILLVSQEDFYKNNYNFVKKHALKHNQYLPVGKSVFNTFINRTN